MLVTMCAASRAIPARIRQKSIRHGLRHGYTVDGHLFVRAFQFYEVENIIRVGTAGVIDPSLKVRDIVMGMGACTNSNYAAQFDLPGTYAPICSYPLLKKAIEAAEAKGIEVKVGNIYSSDAFYDDAGGLAKWQKWAYWRRRWRPLPCT